MSDRESPSSENTADDLSPADPSSDNSRAGRRNGPARVRGRAVLVVIIAVAVIASGVALDRVGVRPAAGGEAFGPRTGAWFCPHGGGHGWRGSVVVSNPSPSAARVRITSFGSNGALGSTSFTVEPSHVVSSPIIASEFGASTEVEYFGGWVTATAVVQSTRAHDALEERCANSPERTWLMPDESTAQGEAAYLVVMNPFSVPAEFDVVIQTERRVIRPGALTPEVLNPGRSEAIPLNKYVLEGPGERTVGAQVKVRMGRVIAGSLVVSPEGVRAEVGLSGEATRWIIPAGGFGSNAELVVMNTGSRSATVSVLQQGIAGSTTLVGPGGGSVEPGAARTLVAEGTLQGGVLVRSTNHVPFAAALRLSGPAGGIATLTGAPAAAKAWVIGAAAPPEGGRGLLVIQNPGGSAAPVTIRLYGPAGEVVSPVPTQSVSPGTTVTVDLSAEIGVFPLSAVVTSSGAPIVAAGVSYAFGGRAFASTVAMPMSFS